MIVDGASVLGCLYYFIYGIEYQRDINFHIIIIINSVLEYFFKLIEENFLIPELALHRRHRRIAYCDRAILHDKIVKHYCFTQTRYKYFGQESLFLPPCRNPHYLIPIFALTFVKAENKGKCLKMVQSAENFSYFVLEIAKNAKNG